MGRMILDLDVSAFREVAATRLAIQLSLGPAQETADCQKLQEPGPEQIDKLPPQDWGRGLPSSASGSFAPQPATWLEEPLRLM